VKNVVLVHEFDDYDLQDFVRVAAEFGSERYGYVVTPNVDHLIRYHDDPAFRALYSNADYVLLDSRFLSYVLRIAKRIRARVCTGSDLTAQIFQNVAGPADRIILIGGTVGQAEALALRYGLTDFCHHNPPMGFIRSPDAVNECLEFIERKSPFRFCLLAVGSPQQEIVAQSLKQRGHARGLALCIGASINFLTGTETRAPLWMQRAALEWLYRLVQDPGRLARRYLIRGPRVFGLLRKFEFRVRVRADEKV
jgi:exopolysaccharide biosynthesis WecB/TagA/CpsF family protein